MATRKTKASKRSGTAKGGRGVAKKSKPSTGRKKARPAAKAGRKSTAKAKRPAKKVAARKAPAKRKTAKPPKAAKPARPAKTAKTAGRKAAKKAPRPATRKAPAPKAERKRVAVKKAAAPPKAVQPKPAATKAATKPAPAVAPRTPPVPAPQAVPETAVAVVEPAQAKAEAAPAAEAKPGLPAIRPYRGTQGGRPAKTKARPKKRARNRYSKLFAEFETRPAPPERKKKRRSMDEEEEETSISVLRERPKLQIESPEQIRAGVIKKYLETGQPSCPVGCGGIAEVVRVGTLEDGSGEVWIECLSCAQRERFQVPRATPAERQAAQQAMEDAGEAMCPRHGRPVQLRRRGRDLVCPECGVLYPET